MRGEQSRFFERIRPGGAGWSKGAIAALAATEETMRILQNIGIWATVGGLTLILTGAAFGQNSGSNSGSSNGSSNPNGMPTLQGGGGRSNIPTSPVSAPPSPLDQDDTGIPPQTEIQQARMRNVERQKQLVADTQKLLDLANQLKADVDKSTKDTMSLDVIRKADEIEKLAHNVKEKMKGT